MNYDKQYAEIDALFGTEPEATLEPHLVHLPPGLPLLDIGAGQGRNALWLASREVTVHALEPSRVAAASMIRAAENEFSPLELHMEHFEQFTPPVEYYGGILTFGIWPDLSWPTINRLVEAINSWTRPDSMIWATGFTVEDPAYDEIRSTWGALARNSYENTEGGIRTFFEPGQILDLFPGYKVFHHWDGLGPIHRHGDAPPECHGRFEAVLMKKEA